MSTACIRSPEAGTGEQVQRDKDLTQRLAEAGLGPSTIEAALQVDATMQRWRRRVVKRRLERWAIDELGLDLDVPRIDVLTAIWGPTVEFGHAPEGETMVATIASRLAIDPSRASRMVSDLIASGHARRVASQRDARRTIVELTDEGRAVVLGVREMKIRLLAEFLQDWTEDEIAAFLPLLERFSAWTDRIARPDEEIETGEAG